MGDLTIPYACEGALVYRLAAPEVDHYFFINDDEAKEVRLQFRDYQYQGVTDPISGETLQLGDKIALEAYSGHWLRFLYDRF